MLCPKCGAQLKDGARFCPACGTPVDTPVEEQNQVDQATAPNEQTDSTASSDADVTVQAAQDADTKVNAGKTATNKSAATKKHAKKRGISRRTLITCGVGLGVLALGGFGYAQWKKADDERKAKEAAEREAEEEWKALSSTATLFSPAYLAANAFGDSTPEGYLSDAGYERDSVTIGDADVSYLMPNDKILAAKEGVKSRKKAKKAAKPYHKAAEALLQAAMGDPNQRRYINLSDLTERGVTQEQLDLLADMAIYVSFNGDVDKEDGGPFSDVGNGLVIYLGTDKDYTYSKDLFDELFPSTDEDVALLDGEGEDNPRIVQRSQYSSDGGLVYQSMTPSRMVYHAYDKASSGDLYLVAYHCMGEFKITTVNRQFSTQSLASNEDLFNGNLHDNWSY